MIHLLCVEDDPVVRRYLVSRLTAEPDIRLVGAVPDIMRALIHLRQQAVDVVLLDYDLPGLDGSHLAQSLCPWRSPASAGSEGPRVLFCTALAGEDFEAKARLTGARGVVAKDRLAKDLLPAVRAVAGGGGWFESNVDALA